MNEIIYIFIYYFTHYFLIHLLIILNFLYLEEYMKLLL